MQDTKGQNFGIPKVREVLKLGESSADVFVNLGMYSLVYLMYCTLMFILGSIYNVIESCHTPMFLSVESIM